MQKIAQDLDYIIRNNKLERTDSNIEGDRQLGTTCRLFYRYEWDSGRYKDEVLDLSKQSDSNTCHSRYDENRGIDPITGESRYLANDMTPVDDIWLNFDPSVRHSKAIIEKRFSIRSYLEKNFPNEFNNSFVSW